MKRCRTGIVLTCACWVLSTGCRTPCEEATFARPFEPRRVAQLAHESFKLAWDARLSAQTDLRFASSRPTHLDWSVVRYLQQIATQAPWIAIEIEEHPDMSRCASKSSCDNVVVQVALLRTAYRPDAFRIGTTEKIAQLLRNLDEISLYYQAR